jgi:MFS family permease
MKPHEQQTGSAMYLAGVCLVASLGGLLFGFDTAVISGTVKRVTGQFGLTELQEGWFTSAALVGCIVGAAVAGWLGDRYGRKPNLIVAAILSMHSAPLPFPGTWPPLACTSGFSPRPSFASLRLFSSFALFPKPRARAWKKSSGPGTDRVLRCNMRGQWAHPAQDRFSTCLDRMQSCPTFWCGFAAIGRRA